MAPQRGSPSVHFFCSTSVTALKPSSASGGLPSGSEPAKRGPAGDCVATSAADDVTGCCAATCCGTEGALGAEAAGAAGLASAVMSTGGACVSTTGAAAAGAA